MKIAGSVDTREELEELECAVKLYIVGKRTRMLSSRVKQEKVEDMYETIDCMELNQKATGCLKDSTKGGNVYG